MAYRVRYQVNVDWVGPGEGPMNSQGPLNTAGGAQTKAFFGTPNYANTNVAGGGAGGILAAADVTTLTNAIAADIAAQMNVAANLAQLQGFATGGG